MAKRFRNMSEDRPDSVCVALLEGSGNDARVLIMRRSRGAFAGAWTFVLGGIEKGERAPAAAIREVGEETGLRVEQLYLAGAFDTFYDPRRDTIRKVAVFAGRVATRDVRLDDAHDDYRWVTFAEANELLEFPSQRRLLPDLERDFIRNEPRGWRRLDTR